MPVESGSAMIGMRQRTHRKLNVCVVLEQTSPPAWWHSLLRLIDSNPNLDLVRVLVSTSASPAVESTNSTKQPTYLTRMVQRFECAIVQGIVDRPQLQYDPLKRSTLESCFQDRIEHIAPSENGSCNLLNTALAQLHVDVIIQSHDVTRRFHSSPPARLWTPDLTSLRTQAIAALTARDPFFHVRLLQRLGGDEDPTSDSPDWAILASHTLPLQTFSITDLEAAAHACLPALFISQLNWLRLGHENVPGTASESDPYRYNTSSKPACSSARTEQGKLCQERSVVSQIGGPLRLLCQQYRQRLRNLLYYEQWQMGFLTQLEIKDSIDELTRTPVESYRPLTPPDRHSWADPHLTTKDGSLYVFFEAIEDRATVGWINCAPLVLDDFSHTPTKALTSDHHLSYPFTFQHEDQHWMIPETSSSGTVSLYRNIGFPDQWEWVAHLMTGVNVADCTVLHQEGRWWLFGNTMTHPAVNERDELRIWYADELIGPWQPHALNPVLTGVHHARMAGGFLHSGGQLYRPSQYGGWRYGHAINIARVDRLTLEDYHETIVDQIRPRSDSTWLGCHSITHHNGTTLIDRVRRRSRLAQWIRARV